MFQAKVDFFFRNKASQQQKDMATQNANFATQLQGQFGQEFANSQQIQGSLNNQLQNITNMGLSGQGMTPAEEAAQRTDSTEQQANQTTQAQQGLGQQLAAKSDGGALTSGALAQNQANLANASAVQNSQNQRNITTQNASLARQNLQMGLAGTGQLAGQEANQATGMAGAASSMSQGAYNDVTQAYQPSNFWSNIGGGLLGGVANAVAPGIGGALTSGASSLFGGGGSNPGAAAADGSGDF